MSHSSVVTLWEKRSIPPNLSCLPRGAFRPAVPRPVGMGSLRRVEPAFLLLPIVVANVEISDPSQDEAPDLSVHSVHAQSRSFENAK